MNWLYFAALFVLFHGLHSICVKYAGTGITPIYAMLISNIVVFTLSVAIFLTFKMNGMEMTATKPAIAWIIAAGICVVIFEIAFFYVFYAGAPLANAATIMRTGSLLIVIIGAYFLFKEDFNISKLAGVLLGAASIYLLSKK